MEAPPTPSPPLQQQPFGGQATVQQHMEMTFTNAMHGAANGMVVFEAGGGMVGGMIGLPGTQLGGQGGYPGNGASGGMGEMGGGQ